MPDVLTRGTAWLAMAALAASLACRLRAAPERDAVDPPARWWSTAGCALLWIHVACAFQFEHRWSHAAAYAHTARRTAELAGLEWGGGLFFNYFLMFVWTADAAWWWLRPQSYGQRAFAVSVLIYGFAAFMAFNATVVFGAGLVRWIALGVSGYLGWLAIYRRTRRE